jgi:prephenate dehydratase
MLGMDTEFVPHNDRLELWHTANRSGMIITVSDDPGALVKILNIFDSNSISLTAIHSKPPKKIDG